MIFQTFLEFDILQVGMICREGLLSSYLVMRKVMLVHGLLSSIFY